MISESGPAFETGANLVSGGSVRQRGERVGAGDAQSTPLQKLRALPAAEVEALVVKAKEHLPADITSATADGWVLPMSPQQAFLTGSIQKVDLLIGLNGRELSAFRLAAAAAAKASGQSNAAESGGAEEILRGRPSLFRQLDQSGYRALFRQDTGEWSGGSGCRPPMT